MWRDEPDIELERVGGKVESWQLKTKRIFSEAIPALINEDDRDLPEEDIARFVTVAAISMVRMRRKPFFQQWEFPFHRIHEPKLNQTINKRTIQAKPTNTTRGT